MIATLVHSRGNRRRESAERAHRQNPQQDVIPSQRRRETIMKLSIVYILVVCCRVLAQNKKKNSSRVVRVLSLVLQVQEAARQIPSIVTIVRSHHRKKQTNVTRSTGVLSITYPLVWRSTVSSARRLLRLVKKTGPRPVHIPLPPLLVSPRPNLPIETFYRAGWTGSDTPEMGYVAAVRSIVQTSSSSLKRDYLIGTRA